MCKPDQSFTDICWAWEVLREVNPTFSCLFPSEAAKAAHQSAIGGLVVDTPPHPALGNIVGPAAGLSNVPPPYQPVSVRHLDSQSSSEEPQDYLWLVNCESKKPEPNRWVFVLCVYIRLLIHCAGALNFSLYIFQPISFSSFCTFHLCSHSCSSLCCVVCSSVQLHSPSEGDQEYLLLEECESKTLPPQASLWVASRPAGTACLCVVLHMRHTNTSYTLLWIYLACYYWIWGVLNKNRPSCSFSNTVLILSLPARSEIIQHPPSTSVLYLIQKEILTWQGLPMISDKLNFGFLLMIKFQFGYLILFCICVFSF